MKIIGKDDSDDNDEDDSEFEQEEVSNATSTILNLCVSIDRRLRSTVIYQF